MFPKVPQSSLGILRVPLDANSSGPKVLDDDSVKKLQGHKCWQRIKVIFRKVQSHHLQDLGVRTTQVVVSNPLKNMQPSNWIQKYLSCHPPGIPWFTGFYTSHTVLGNGISGCHQPYLKAPPTVDGWNPIPNHLGWCEKNPINNGISTTNLNWWVYRISGTHQQ